MKIQRSVYGIIAGIILFSSGNSFDVNALESAAQDSLYVNKDTTTVELLPAVAQSVELPEGILFGKFTKDDGTLYIKGNVVIPSGQTLELGPGCKVYIGGEYTTITVFGQIIVKGDAKDPVIFMSARKNPNPWDWDRIYCRSKNRSQFENCIIRHSNYGIVVENGSASIKNALFERNSLDGLVVSNSDVELSTVTFTGGHAIAVNIRKGGVVTADSLIIKDNNSGIACDSFATLKLSKGVICKNTHAIIVSPKSSVSIVAAEITQNRNGLVTSVDIPRRTREMIFGNGLDVKTVGTSELYSIMKEPQAIKSIALPKSSPVKQQENFKAGFTAFQAPQEPNTSFIGNVTTGFSYNKPKSIAHPVDDTLRYQQKYIGEQSDKWYAGLQPEIQVFGNGKRGAVDVNLLLDMYENDWLSTRNYLGKNMLNLSLSYNPHTVVIGDFFESGSETSISGRQMTGIKYTGSFFTMGAGMYRVNVKLAAGESEVPKDLGQRELNIINDTVDTGMSVRQQITYLASASVKPSKNSTVIVKGMIAQDQIDKPFLRKTIEDINAPEPIKAQTGGIEGNLNILDDKVTLYSELDLGTHDSVTGNDRKNTAWYNPQVEKAVPEVFGLLNAQKFSKHYAYTGGARTTVKGINLDASLLQIGKNYFSAGNPYLESDRRVASLKGSKQINQNISVNGSYDCERTSLSATSNDYHTLEITGEYQAEENKPSFSADYTFKFENCPSTERVQMIDSSYTASYDDRAINNMISVEVKQTLKNGIGYSLRYQFMNDNDISDHPDVLRKDIGDRFQNQINGWFSFKVKKMIKNKTTFRVTLKNENRDSLKSIAYKFGNTFNVTIIPRKLTCMLTGEYGTKTDREFVVDTVAAYWTDTKNYLYSIELETKYSLTPKVSFTLKGRDEFSYDEAPASVENYKFYMIGFYSTWLF